MRVVYKFGDFRMWDEIENSKLGQDIYLIHPPIYLTTEPIKPGDLPTLIIKKMRFEYSRRLDFDLVEYCYAGEDL